MLLEPGTLLTHIAYELLSAVLTFVPCDLQDAGSRGQMSNVLRIFNDSVGVVSYAPT